MTQLEALLYEHKSRVFERIQKLAVDKDEDAVLMYWLQTPKSDKDPTERDQAMILRGLHEESVIAVAEQKIDCFSFRIIKKRFQEAANFYSNETWAIRRAMGAFALERLSHFNPKRSSSTSITNINNLHNPETITVSGLPEAKPLPPPLDWDDTPYSKREHSPTGIMKEGARRIVYSGSLEVSFDGKLRCSILDYLYQPENRDHWCRNTEVVKAVSSEDKKRNSKEVGDAVEEINNRWSGATSDEVFQLIAVRKRGDQQKSPRDYKWAL